MPYEVAQGVGDGGDKDIKPSDSGADVGRVEHDVARHGVVAIPQSVGRVFERGNDALDRRRRGLDQVKAGVDQRQAAAATAASIWACCSDVIGLAASGNAALTATAACQRRTAFWWRSMAR
jgi:hypothetical protein